MRKTTNYGLALYDVDDKMSITASENSLNANMVKIDNVLKEKATIEDMTTYIDEHKDKLKGADGKDGVDGYSPSAKVETTTTGATITISDKNGTTTTTIANGKDGKVGEKGEAFRYEDFTEEQLASLRGKDGVDGYSPIKGTDYYTEEDKNEIVNLVLEALPNASGVKF